MRWLVFALVIAPLAGCIEVSTDPAGSSTTPATAPDAQLLSYLQELASFPELRFTTDHGTIRAVLYTDWLPGTTAHISALVERGFYDGTTIHRVVDDFVIQGGDPTGTGEGGSGPAGTSDMIPLEIKPGLDFGSGAIGLARWTDDTGDSQWFITEKPALHLSQPTGTTGEVFGAYALFGQVFEGMEVVREIAEVATLPNDRPITDVMLELAEMLPPPSDANLLGLIPNVIEPFDLWMARDAAVEVPQWGIDGVPMTFRVHVPPTEDAFGATQPCPRTAVDGNQIWPGGDADKVVPTWVQTSDSCTFETTFTPTAGHVTFIGSESVRANVPAGLRIPVEPWHDAYAPFVG